MKKDETLVTFTYKGRSVTVAASTLARAAGVVRKRGSGPESPLKEKKGGTNAQT